MTLLKTFNAFKQKEGDADWCWKNYLNYRALKQSSDIRDQLAKILVQQKCSMISKPATDPNYYVNIRKCILSGFFM